MAIASSVFSMEWYRAYNKGRDAVEKGRCADGKSLLLEALQGNPRPDLRARTYGTFRTEYIPHYYLAVCAVEEGNLKLAEDYLNQAEAGGILSSSKATEFTALRKQIQSMKPEPRKPEPSPPSTARDSSTREAAPDSPPPVERKPEVRPSASAQQTEKQLVDSILKDARTAMIAERYSEARDAANRVLLLDKNNPSALRIVKESEQKETLQLREQEKQARLREINQLLRSGNVMKAQSLAITLQAQFPEDRNIAALVQEISKKKENDSRRTERAEMQRLIEKQVIVAYYRGQYQAVVQLAQQGIQSIPDSWYLYFYQGCSYAALSFLEGEGSDTRLEKAKESFRRAKRIRSSISAPQISPKIIEIFQAS